MALSLPGCRRYLVIVVLFVVIIVIRSLMSRVPAEKSRRTRNQISILTYNIWFKPEKMRERMEALGQIVEDLEPDILSFQEVTLDNLAVLRKQSWFSRYHLIPPDVNSKLGKSFVVILSVFPVKNWFLLWYRNSKVYKRKMVVAELKNTVRMSSRSIDFVIAGTHLAYAGERTLAREQQLQEATKRLSAYTNVCLVGDLNIEDKVDGEIVLARPWIDAWLSIPGNTDSNGLTWDRSKTPFASVLKRTVNATSYQARLDRVLCKLPDFKVKEVKVVGKKVTKSGILPSDHFGLFAVIEFSQNAGKDQNIQTNKEVHFKRPSGWKKLI